MIAGVASVALLALVLALVPAAVGTSATRRPVALAAAPSRVLLEGSGHATVRVVNSGTSRVDVDVGRAGFGLDMRGRPRIVRHRARRSAARWLTFRPRHLALPAGGSASLVVTSRVPTRAEPGDHDALVLFTSRPRRDAIVGVRMRLGVVVVVRAPGRVVRRLRLGRLHVLRRRRARLLELLVANRGNVTESVERARTRMRLRQDGHPFATLAARSRTFRPRTSGIVEFRYGGRRRGWVTATVVIRGERGRGVIRRTYRIRL